MTIQSSALAIRLRFWAMLCLMGLLFLQSAQAHLMVAQRGTLNFVGTGGFVVMSLPVDAFTGIDDDGDGRMSAAEMSAHSSDIEAQVFRGLQLIGDAGPRPLEALMLNLSPDDTTPTAPAAHLVVLGRFAIADGDRDALSRLKLRFTLFGKTAAAQQQTITVSKDAETQKMVLARGREERKLFPSALTELLDNAALGAEHVISGPDHLLFLLVVLACGWGWRYNLLALTCFTAGHAITMAAVVLGGLSVSARVVEPTIAATIVGIALFDRWPSAGSQPLASRWRLALVFGCSLVHGLGLAGALTSLGLDSTHRLLSLAGFNLGIEMAQLGVALAAGVMLWAIRRLRGAPVLALVTRTASFAGIAIGLVWFAQRVTAATAY